MALYGVLGDIHGNREALDAALAALARRGARRLLCLGDIIGYNADPDECVARVRASGALAIAGNHDLIGIGRLDYRRCSTKAEYSLKRTRRTLGRDSAAWLAGLPASLAPEPGVVLVHGGVRDVQLALRGPQDVKRNAVLLAEDLPGARICFFGHSQVQKLYEVEDGEAEEVFFPLERVLLRRDVVYFANPGSVDAQSKPEQRFAECAVFDSEHWAIEFVRVPYDAAAAEARAAARGYRLGPLTRLAYGLCRT